MHNDIFKCAIECIPDFFNLNLETDTFGASIFNTLNKIISFDASYIFFLNPDNVVVKYAFGENLQLNVGEVVSINDDINSKLFSAKSITLNSKDKLVKSLGFLHYNSFLVSKLVIKETVFGFILMAKNEANFYSNEHIQVASAIGSVISYKIKDVELSEIFRSQLKALQEGFVQTKSAYKTIKEQNIKIMEADKVKNEFLANISHELRTPLSAIIGFSEMLSTQLFGDLNTKQLEYVNDIYVSGVHLLGMINELLDISKIEAKAMTLYKSDFSPSQAIEEVVNILIPLAVKKSIIINVNIQENRAVHADFQKFKQVLYNLLSNAVKFTHNNGKIDVVATFDNNSLYLEVRDNGIGIDKKDHARIFEKFVQLENAYTKTESSTGLGLTITKEFVEMHKGELKLESNLGKGSTFTVKLPIRKS